MKKINSCPICGKKKFKRKITCIDHSNTKEKFNIVSCETCGFIFTNPKPSEDNIKYYYNTEKYISHTDSNKGLLNFLYQIIRRYTVKKKASLITKHKNNSRILDVGCGTGDFLNACKIQGHKTTGVETSVTARQRAYQKFKIKIPEDSNLKQFSKNSFDFITMWHVLEHVYDLNKFLKSANKILCQSGHIIIAVPNYKSWDAKYYKEYWAAWDVPLHQWHFSKSSLIRILLKHNFELIETKPMIFDSFYISILSEEYKNKSKNLFKSFIIGCLSNINAVFSKNGHSSNIYVFKKLK